MNVESSSIPSPNTTVDEKIAFIQKLARLDQASVARTAADFPESLFEESPVGRGYNIFGAFADNASVQGAVLDFAKMKSDGLITATPINDSDTLIVAGTTLQQVSESMSASVSASGSVGFGTASFAGSMSSSFSKETMFRHEYHYANLYQLHRVARVKLLADMVRLRDSYMTPLAADVINSPSVAAEQVIDFFGTHVLADAVYGARFEYSSATNIWAYAAKTSAAVAVEVSFQSLTGSGSGESDFSSTEEREEYDSNSVTRVRAAGGDSELAGGLDDLDAWRATIDDNDPVLVQFAGSQPLLPIWEFAQSEARRRELQAAVEDIASRIGAVVNGDRDLVIAAQIKCLDAADEGGGNLELFGVIDAAILDARGAVVWAANLLSIPSSGGYVVLKTGEVYHCGAKTALIEGSSDPTGYTLRMRTELTERDTGSSADDYFGLQIVETKFVEGRLLGDHVVQSGGNKLELTFNVSLAD